MEEYITNKSEIDLISCYQFFKRLATKLKKKNN